MALRGAKALQSWCKQVTEGYEDVNIENMTKSWRDGLAFCAIIHNYRPELIDFDALSKENIRENNSLAFEVAERELGIPALLDPEDMATMLIPDRLSILTYVSQYYNYFHGKSPAKKRPKGSGIANIGKKREKSVVKDPSEPPRKVSTMGDKCISCGKKVYLMERLVIEGKLFHRACFKCSTCQATLRSGTYKKTRNSGEFECLRHGNDIWKIRANITERAAAKSNPKPVAVSSGDDIWQSKSGTPIKMEIEEAKEDRERAGDDDPWASRIDLIPNQKKSPKIPRRKPKPELFEKPELARKPVGGVKLPTVPLHPHLLAAQTSRARFQGTDDTRKGLMKSLAAVRSDRDSSSFGSKDSLSSISSHENVTSSTEILTPPPRHKIGSKAAKYTPPKTNPVTTSNLEAPPRKKGGLISPVAVKKIETPAETDDNVKKHTENSVTIETSVVVVGKEAGKTADGIQTVEDRRNENGNVENELHETEAGKKREYEKDNEKDKDEMEGVEVYERGKLDLEEKGKVDEKNSEKDIKNEPTDQTSGEREDVAEKLTNEGMEQSKKEIDISSNTVDEDNYDDNKNPFAESEDSDYSGDNPFGEVDSDEEYDETMNPFKDNEDDEENGEGVNPFTGSPVNKSDFNYPPRTPPSKTQEHSGVSYSVKSRTEILKEMQRDRATLKQKKRRAPPRPSAPPGQSPGAAGGLTPPPRQSKKKEHKAPLPPKAENDSQLEFQKLQQKMLEGKNTGNVMPASPSLLRPKQNGLNRHAGGTPDSVRKRKSHKTSKAPPPPLIKREVEKHHVDTLVIQRELKEIEIKQNDMERKGVKLEERLREQMNEDGANDEVLLIEWFELVNNKNQLVRREGELVCLAQSQELEKKHAEIEFDLRRIMLKREHEKTDADAVEEQRLLDLLVDVVTKRGEVVDRLENDRIREEQEDENIRVMMRESGLSKAPISSQKVKSKKEAKKEKRKSRGILW